MSRDAPPSRPTGDLTLEEMWRQLCAGFITVPCTITNSGNFYTLKPRLHQEGARSYGDGMIFTGTASATSTGTVTARVASPRGSQALATVNVYKSNGAANAAANDVVSGSLYLWIYSDSLGGFVLK